MSQMPVLDIKGRYGLDLSHYYTKKIKEMLDRKIDGDGKLNSYNREIIGEFNVYLIASREVIYLIRVAEHLLEDCEEKYNLINTRRSLGKQRNLVKSIKYILKRQGINKDWYDLFVYELNKLNKRMKWVEDVVIKLNTETTVLDIYMRELEIKGISFTEDMENYLTMEEPDEFGCMLNMDGELMDKYIQHVEDVINRSILSEEEKQEYLAKKETQLRAKAERMEKVRASVQAEKKKWYEDTCNELMANAYFAEKHLISTYKGNKQIPRLTKLAKCMAETGEEYYTVFVCRKHKGRNNLMYLSKYEEDISLTSNIKQCCFVPASKMTEVEEMLKKNNIAYGCYHIDGDRLQTIFDAVGYEMKVVYSRTGLFFDKDKDGTYREDVSEYIEGAYCIIKEEYCLFTIYIQESGKEKMVGISDSIGGARIKARNYVIDYRNKKRTGLSEEEIEKDLGKRLTKSPLLDVLEERKRIRECLDE